jgi:hypothetical protein
MENIQIKRLLSLRFNCNGNWKIITDPHLAKKTPFCLLHFVCRLPSPDFRGRTKDEVRKNAVKIPFTTSSYSSKIANAIALDVFKVLIFLYTK